MADKTEILTALHAGLAQRRTPQQVAVQLIKLGADQWLPADEAAELAHLGRYGSYFSSMRDSYRQHPGLQRAYEAAHRAVAAVATAAGKPAPAQLQLSADNDVALLAGWVADAVELLGLDADSFRPARATSPRKRVTREGWWGESYTAMQGPKGQRGHKGGHVDARTRYTAAERRQALPGVSVRTYRRAVRAVLHLQQRVGVLAAERDREAATAFGKARLASTIGLEAFCASEKAAAFVAYYTARLGMRTQFTAGTQDRPMDTVAEALLTAALKDEPVRADVIAAVLTRQSVLRLLTEEQKGALLATYYEQLAAAARVLRRAFDANRDRTTMVVRRGDDSSSWNAGSRAFNQARTGWLNLTVALGLGALVEASCPGKVPALVASDVAHWHTREGGQQHQDVTVWAQLPLPWDVVLDGAPAPAAQVREVCAEAELDADATGWTSPYRQAHVEVPVIAPELVHGVVVGSPLLAGLLRAAGVFSGQALTDTQQALLENLPVPVRG